MKIMPPLTKDQLDIITKIFGIKFTDGGSYGLCNLYVEDDENYHFVTSFDIYWLPDLADIATKAKEMKPVQ